MYLLLHLLSGERLDRSEMMFLRTSPIERSSSSEFGKVITGQSAEAAIQHYGVLPGIILKADPDLP